MSYFPESPPKDYDPEYLYRELLRIVDAINQIHDHEIFHNEPDKLYDGMIRYADGTDWNPGSGEGLYERNNGAWVKL
jgi:hypothetical protein